MKKIIGFLFLMVVIISSCEKDDFCTQNPVTPKLILAFYNTDSRNDLKTIEQLYVWAEGKEDSLLVNVSQDSIFIPLNVNSNQTVYNLSKDNVVEQFTIDYTPENRYVSRSCGYKIIFNDLTFSTTNNWVTDFTAIETSLENQDSAHVQIFH
jgi:hypothetical protein